MSETLTEESRKNIFHALVTTQDEGVSVGESREKVATDFSLSVDDVCRIEREGLDAQWPPL